REHGRTGHEQDGALAVRATGRCARVHKGNRTVHKGNCQGGMLKSYEQYCPVACALDVVGDRWTLLVLRELSLGPQRFTDLRRQLVGTPPKLPGERLDPLQGHGLVERRPVDDGARHVYALTEDGEAIREPLRALARFGIQFLPEGTPHDLRPRGALS